LHLLKSGDICVTNCALCGLFFPKVSARLLKLIEWQPITKGSRV
jgi:hypothetical protein